MRLFVALEIPAAVCETFATLLQEFRNIASQAADKRPRWVRSGNLHITLKFIGQTPLEKLDSLRTALCSVPSTRPVDITFRGLGFFPHEKRAKVFWAGLVASPNLPVLAADIDRVLAAQHVAPETREFAPHLTLARFEPPGLPEKLRTAIQQNCSREFGAFQAREFHLIESKTKPSGAEYTRLASFPLAMES